MHPTLDDILTSLRSSKTLDRDLVTRAYTFAEEAHRGHVRASGEPYFVHLASTACILADNGLDAETIAAGLLHDSIEDVGVTPETIRDTFGPEILFLVEGVTKLGKLRYRGAKRHVESLRKLFLATSEDVRVLAVKLADRLHNMETLEHLRPEKRERIALETLEIYAPLAYRLGMGRLKGQLEDLAFEHLHPEEFKRVRDLRQAKTKEGIERLKKMHRSIMKLLAAESVPVLKADYRVKHAWSLYKKLQANDWHIETIYDTLALRIVVNDISDCYRVLGLIHSKWRPLASRIKDYIALPKPNGYQSLHTTVFTGDGGIVEIQIRTEAMHQRAEFGLASHIAYKEGKIGAADLTWLQQLKENQEGVVRSADFLKNLKTDLWSERVFVFTPQGDVVDLPVGSTAVDFAYAIHSDIGNHMAGAKINGKMSAIDAALENGDIVEIETRKSSKPNRKWLAFAKTTLAKRHIRAALR
jgi:GTP diphosphokinase / guanosine-3',5'-bis(diphosphate) 3'-diphosphatase